jgi:hypothetical protein
VEARVAFGVTYDTSSRRDVGPAGLPAAAAGPGERVDGDVTGPGRRARVIACATVIEELRPLLPPEIEPQVLDFGLHTRPAALREALQAEIDAGDDVEVILLGYSMCSRAVIGVRARRATLVMPRVHDCIAIFLGSHGAYTDVGDSPFEQVKRLSDRYGPQRARRMVDLMLRHYTRLAFINTGAYQQEEFADYARRTAEEFGLRFEEIDGVPDLVRKLVDGPWDDDLVVVPPGGEVTAELFAQPVPAQPVPAQPVPAQPGG